MDDEQRWASAGGKRGACARAGGRRPTACNGWLFGLLLAGRVGVADLRPADLLCWKRSRQLLVGLTVPRCLSLVLWDYTAPQPRIRLDAVQLQKDAVQRSARPRRVASCETAEMSRPTSRFCQSRIWRRSIRTRQRPARQPTSKPTLRERLKQATPTAAAPDRSSTTGQTTLVNVEVPFSERAWQFARGELTVLVTARIQYRDRIFPSRTTVLPVHESAIGFMGVMPIPEQLADACSRSHSTCSRLAR